MAVYTVHEPLGAAGASPPPEHFVFVRDGFSLWAALFGPLWMLRHRMWLVLVGYGMVVVALGVILRLADAPSPVEMSAAGLLAVLVGFEAGTLRRFTLSRRGYRNVGVVVGDDTELVERRFFDAWADGATGGEKPLTATAPGRSPPLAMPLGSSHVIGLFPEPGAPR
jgi:hypothetical protein